jgi:pimeloyl-ACP methyl ester carboxylesterase
LPHSELWLVPGVGHMVHHSVPDAVLAAIQAIDAKQAPNREAHGSPAFGM